jgi:hypothetical protein
MPATLSAIPVTGAQSPYLTSSTETYSTNILGPVMFSLSNLRVGGLAGLPTMPTQVAPAQSVYVIAANEPFEMSVDITFNKTPLTDLLLCLESKICVDFALEGFGKKAVETDVEVCIKTQKDVHTYTVTYTGTPAGAGLTYGFYEMAGVVSVGTGTHACSQGVFGYGYIGEMRFQVYG